MYSRQIVAIAGPSGSGESTFTKELVIAYPQMVRAVSATTRPPRAGEEEGVDYYYMDKTQFFEAVQSGDIPEHVFVRDRDAHYGTYWPDIQTKLEAGKIVIVNVDLAGARYFKHRFGATTIFIKPKSLDVLRDRIVRRDPSVSDAEVNLRLTQAMSEINSAEGQYDYVVFNTDGEFADTMTDVVDILQKRGYKI